MMMIFKHAIHMFKQLTWPTCQVQRATITSKSSSDSRFLKRGQVFERSHSFGISLYQVTAETNVQILDLIHLLSPPSC